MLLQKRGEGLDICHASRKLPVVCGDSSAGGGRGMGIEIGACATEQTASRQLRFRGNAFRGDRALGAALNQDRIRVAVSSA